MTGLMDRPESPWQIALPFLKLGCIAFGGPAASIAMMRREFVLRRQWLDEDAFFDLLGLTNLIPGPNATELAIHIGYRKGGRVGLVVAGVSYILPAMVIVLGFAWAYVRWGTLPALDGMLSGIKPVVIAILVDALFGILKPRLSRWDGLLVALGALIGYVLGASPLVLLLAGGIALLGLGVLGRSSLLLAGIGGVGWPGLFLQPISPEGFSLLRLFWVFLKAGALMYGSGYVLLAFIQDDLVNRLAWLTQSQLLDAIAVGQLTPGPLSTTATFVGYLTGGWPAALLATLAMFLPGFIFVALTHPLLASLRKSGRAGAFLDGVNFASIGLMAGVTWEVGVSALVDPLSVVLALAALVLLLRFNLSASWLILGGGTLGLLQGMVLGS